MNATRSYPGPERRIRDDAIDGLRDHLDTSMKAMREHVDEKFKEQAAKLDPIHEHYIMARRGASIIGWMATIGGGVAAAWAALKGGKV